MLAAGWRRCWRCRWRWQSVPNCAHTAKPNWALMLKLHWRATRRCCCWRICSMAARAMLELTEAKVIVPIESCSTDWRCLWPSMLWRWWWSRLVHAHSLTPVIETVELPQGVASLHNRLHKLALCYVTDIDGDPTTETGRRETERCRTVGE